MPFSFPSAAALKAALISSTVVFLESSAVRSTSETFGVGTRIEVPFSLPFSSGITSPNVSLVDLTAELSRKTTVEEINAAFKAAAEGKLKGILQYNAEPTVSVDYNGNPASSIFDSTQTAVADDGKFVKEFSGYANEWGFSHRMVDVSLFIGGKL